MNKNKPNFREVINLKKFLLLLMAAALAFSLTACGSTDGGEAGNGLQGNVKIDGSSTVYPITEAISEEFQAENPDAQVTIGVSGTGGGFTKFLNQETDINNASRPIKDKEVALAEKNSIEYIEIPIAYDGLSVVVNKENDWVDYLTIEELNKIWEPNSQITKWSQVREGWPDKEIKLYGPGTSSGTFDYFTETVNGESGASRADYTASEDDNVLVIGISGDKYSLGYFGFAYYIENKDDMKVVPIEAGNGAIEPTLETINNGTYAPLSRPVFIYVNKASLSNETVYEYVKFYIENASYLAEEVGYVSLPAEQYEENLELLETLQ